MMKKKIGGKWFGQFERSERKGKSASRHVLEISRNCKVLSLDVFDTTLTRACGPPGGVFIWLGRRLYQRGIISCTPEVFARTRMRAEQQVWQRSGGMDSHVFLEDFYREVVRWLWMDEGLVDLLVASELEMEIEVLKVIPPARELVDMAVRAGRRVVFCSDTYFPGDFIEKQLKRLEVWSHGAVCFASCDLGKSKASGKLFESVLQTLNLPAASIAHAGDNIHSDVRVPGYKGFRTAWLHEGCLNRYEKMLGESAWATSGTGAALAGASRMARLHTKADGAREEAIRDVTAGVAAPIVLGYVLWLIHRARDLGLERLYFLARDGQVFFDVAGILLRRLGWPIRASYLHASRLSTNLAATFKAADEELAWVFRDLSSLSLKDFFARFDISWEEIGRVIEEMGLNPDKPSITPEEGRALKSLVTMGPVRDLLLDKAASRRKVVRMYLKQEGLLDGEPCGMVDFGGVGSQMRALHELVVDAGSPPPRIFLMGLDSLKGQYKGLIEVSETPAWLGNTECYLYDHRRGRGVKRARGFGTCVQMFCSADHGKVRGYRVEGDRVVPVLLEDCDSAMLDWGLPVLRETVRHFAEHLVLDGDLVDLRADLREPACKVINLFWSEPSFDEALAWGAFPFEGAQASGGTVKPLARPYSWVSVVKGSLNGSFPDLGWMHWLEGSVKLSPPVLRAVLRVAEKFYWWLNMTSRPWAKRAFDVIRRFVGRKPLEVNGFSHFNQFRNYRASDNVSKDLGS
jgi:FMN phosphatase YigB (HAD superfamily)